MTAFFGLPGWRVERVTGSATQIEVDAVPLTEPAQCPGCLRIAAFTLYRHGTVRRVVIDAPAHGKSVIVRFTQQRYRCSHSDCGRTCFQPLPGVDESRLATERCVAYVEREALRRPFRQVAREVNLSDKTVAAIHAAHVARLDATHRFETPPVISIDGVYVGRRERLVITDPGARLVLAMHPSVKERAVAEALRSLPDRERVQVVAQDMSYGLRRAVEATLLQARIVVDRYHVLSLANDAVDRVRIHLRGDTKKRASMIVRHLLRKHEGQLSADELAQLDWWRGLMPELKEAYQAKESFFHLFNHLTSTAALEAYDEWRGELSGLTEVVRGAFEELVVKTVGNWKAEIFAACDHPTVNNGFAESTNRQIKELQQAGRRCDFETVRAKTLYGTLQKRADEAALSTRWRRTRKPRRAESDAA
jgi:transposase